jgi:hypothetical protein
MAGRRALGPGRSSTARPGPRLGALALIVLAERWIARGRQGHFVVKRLRGAATLLTTQARGRLRASAAQLTGRPYDLTFEWSDDRIYCSELVWKLCEQALGIRLGEPQRLRDFDLSDPEVKAKMHERYGEQVPLDELAVSPAAMFASPQLLTVSER